MAYDLIRLYELVQHDLSAEPRLPLSALSGRLGVCRQTLESAVRTATGKSFREFRRQLLAAKARDLLTVRPFQVKEVAYALGFGSAQAFARFLKKALGCSPTDLRGKRSRSRDG